MTDGHTDATTRDPVVVVGDFEASLFAALAELGALPSGVAEPLRLIVDHTGGGTDISLVYREADESGSRVRETRWTRSPE